MSDQTRSRRSLTIVAATDGGFVVVDQAFSRGPSEEWVFAGSIADCLDYARKALTPPPPSSSND